MTFGKGYFPSSNYLVVPPRPSGILTNMAAIRSLGNRFHRLCYLPFCNESKFSLLKKRFAFSLAFGTSRNIEGFHDYDAPCISPSQYDSLFDLYDLKPSPARYLDLLKLDGSEWLGVNDFLDSLPLGPKVALYPNSKLAMKVWPIEKYVSLARSLRERFNASLLLIGAKEDGVYNQRLASALGGRGIWDIAGRFTIRQTIALLSRLDLIVGNDGAPLHMAALAGTPIVGLYTHKAPTGMWAPTVATRFVTLEGNASCGPCGLTECEDPYCLTSLDVLMVFKYCHDMLLGNFIRESRAIDILPENLQ